MCNCMRRVCSRRSWLFAFDHVSMLSELALQVIMFDIGIARQALLMASMAL